MSAIAAILVLFFLCPLVPGQSIVVQPPAGTFHLRTDLAGKHPRLYFTQADTAAIRQRAKGSCKWFYDKAKSDFGHYVSQRTPDVPGGWKDYLFGFWGQFTMDMIYLVEQDTACANAARAWALYYAGRTDWLKDDLVPMDITTGMALTYDILYNYLSPADRATLQVGLKRSIDTMMVHFFQGEYWTNDYQNNHMHNRIHGIAHAAFALYGDNPAINVQAAADLAVGCFNEVVRWASPDGSTHEGAGYWDYGYHWVARTAELMKFVTGTDPVAGNAHFTTDYLFRLYMSTPGFNNTFCIGDANEGAPGNADAWLPALVRAKDAAADSIFRRLMKEQSGGFYQHTMWDVLWYDPALAPTAYDKMPLYRFWPDLEMFSIRGSWSDTATAFVFKCGPPGGNHMQQLRGTNYINVAHDHPDQNHFLLFAGGRMLAQDDGYPQVDKRTRSHNTITIDTAGQTREGGAWYQPFDYSLCGHLDDVMLSGSSACASGNASKLYTGAGRYVRHVAFIEGGYVISIDDITGAGAGQHAFEWRLHKNGTWQANGGGDYTVSDSSNMRLDIRFLEPGPAYMTGTFLPAELTAQPCLSARVQAASTRITAVLTPQHGGQPVLTSAMLSATGGVAVSVQGSGFSDVYLVRTDTAGITAGDISCNGTENIVRKINSIPMVAMMTRGTRLQVGSAQLLKTHKAANLSWRSLTNGVSVEAEPPYKAAGGGDTLRIGGLTPSKAYALLMDGIASEAVTTDNTGVANLSINLTKRITILLSDQGPAVEKTRLSGGRSALRVRYVPGGNIEFHLERTAGEALSLEIYNLRGMKVRSWNPAGHSAGECRIFWNGADEKRHHVSAGIYLVRMRIGNAFQSAIAVLTR